MNCLSNSSVKTLINFLFSQANLVVYCLVIVQLGITAISIYVSYGFLVENWGNSAAIEDATVIILGDLQPIVDGISKCQNLLEELIY